MIDLEYLISSFLSVVTLLVFFWLAKKIADKQEQKKKSTYVCPQCGSLNIIHYKKKPGDTFFVGSLLSNNYFQCVDCSFKGLFPLIKKNQVDDFKLYLKSVKKESKTSQEIVSKKSSLKKKKTKKK